MKTQTIHRGHMNGYDIVTLASEGEYPAWYRVFNADGLAVGKFPSPGSAIAHIQTLPVSVKAGVAGAIGAILSVLAVGQDAGAMPKSSYAQRATQLERLLQNVAFDPGFEHLRADTRKEIEEAIEGKAHG